MLTTVPLPTFWSLGSELGSQAEMLNHQGSGTRFYIIRRKSKRVVVVGGGGGGEVVARLLGKTEFMIFFLLGIMISYPGAGLAWGGGGGARGRKEMRKVIFFLS